MCRIPQTEEEELQHQWQKERRGRLRDGGNDESVSTILAMVRIGGGRHLASIFPRNAPGRPDDDSPPTPLGK